MLAKQGILTEEEKEQIIRGLDGIVADVDAGKLEITSEYEDIHSFVEATLIDRIGDAGKKLHTGRSRNDQVALDMKLYVRDEIKELDELVKKTAGNSGSYYGREPAYVCQDLPICRKHSRSRWHIIWEHI